MWHFIVVKQVHHLHRYSLGGAFLQSFALFSLLTTTEVQDLPTLLPSSSCWEMITHNPAERDGEREIIGSAVTT